MECAQDRAPFPRAPGVPIASSPCQRPLPVPIRLAFTRYSPICAAAPCWSWAAARWRGARSRRCSRRARRCVVGAPALEPALAAWAAEARIVHRRGAFDSGVARRRLARDRRHRRRRRSTARCAEAGEARRVWVNVVDDADARRVSTCRRASSAGRCRSRFPAAAARRCWRGWCASGWRRHSTNPSARSPHCWRGNARVCARAGRMSANAGAAIARLLAGPLQALLRKRRHIAAEHAFDEALRAATHDGAHRLGRAGRRRPRRSRPAHPARVARCSTRPT